MMEMTAKLLVALAGVAYLIAAANLWLLLRVAGKVGALG
jgi:hypothetical protein